MLAFCKVVPEICRTSNLNRGALREGGVRKGTNGVSTIGVTANCMLFDSGTFWVPICQTLEASINVAYLFHRSVKNTYFCSDLISVYPICPQPRRHRAARDDAPGGRHRRGRGLLLLIIVMIIIIIMILLLIMIIIIIIVMMMVNY